MAVIGATSTIAPSTAPAGTPVSGPVAEPTPPRHYVVLIVIDASRPVYQELARMPHIGALMRSGVVYDRAWVGELESSTPNVHVTFGTGTLPRENGFLGFGWAAPQTRVSVDFRSLLANGGIDPVLKALPLPSVAARLHQFMPGAASVAASGHKDYAVVGLGGGAANYELYGKFTPKTIIPAFMHAPPPLSTAERASLVQKLPLKMGVEDTFGFRYASLVAAHVRPRLLMLNVPEIDTWGHWYGPDNKKIVHMLLANIDRGIGRIEATYRRLGILNRTDFIITADHAMMTSHAARNWRVVQSLATLVNARSVRGDTEGGAVWLQDPGQARAVANRIVASAPHHVQAVFYRSALGDSYDYVQASPNKWLVNPAVATALKHLVDTTAGRNGPDLWVLYRENYTVVPRNVDGIWKGTHGGATWKVQHVPLIISGAGIRHAIHSQFPARAVDIAPTMERLLGLPPIKRDGVILADALADASRPETTAQRGVTSSLAADVEALQKQSIVDSSYDQWPARPPNPLHCTLPPAVVIPPQTPCQITPHVATNQ
ncbi:MAG: hypothetical protein NVS4B2_12280 [Chloroflexota bacterium]